MKNFNKNVSERPFGFTNLTKKIMTRYIGLMYEDAADFSEASIMREYLYLKEENNLGELLEGDCMIPLTKKLLTNYLGNMYEDAADFSLESIIREYLFLRDSENIPELFECDWVFSAESWGPKLG